MSETAGTPAGGGQHDSWVNANLGVDPATYGGGAAKEDAAGGNPFSQVLEAGQAVLDSAAGVVQAAGGVVHDAVDNVADMFGVGPKAAKAKEVTDKVTKMSDDDLKKLSSADQSALLKDIEANGKPTGDARKAQIKIFHNMKLDPAFKQKESERATKVADEVKGDPDVQAASKDWGTRSNADKVKALKVILTAQCKQLGVKVPDIEMVDNPPDPDGSITNGSYNPHDGKLHLNMNAKSSIGKGFDTAIQTATHEISHEYQQDIVKRFRAGKIKPGDPEYAQAQMFDVNDDDQDYIQPSEDYGVYKGQPEEDHARTVGADYMKKVIGAVTKPAAGGSK